MSISHFRYLFGHLSSFSDKMGVILAIKATPAQYLDCNQTSVLSRTLIVTARKRSLSAVCLSKRGDIEGMYYREGMFCLTPPPPPSPIWSTGGRYTSYWNVYLFHSSSRLFKQDKPEPGCCASLCGCFLWCKAPQMITRVKVLRATGLEKQDTMGGKGDFTKSCSILRVFIHPHSPRNSRLSLEQKVFCDNIETMDCKSN